MKAELVCRLCAAPKEPDEIRCAIDDVVNDIERKLIDCCDWYLYRRDVDLPTSVCYTCYLLLEQSLHFRRTVSRAQDKLSARLVTSGKGMKSEADLADVKIEFDGVVETTDVMGDDSNVNETVESSSKDSESDGNDGIENETSLLGPWCNDSSFEDDGEDAADHSDSQELSDCDHAEVMEVDNFREDKDSGHNASVPYEEPAIAVTDQSESRLISSTESNPSPADLSQVMNGDFEDNGNIISDQTDEPNSTTWLTITTKCSLCDNFAGDHVRLQKHYEDVHPNSRLELNCPFCDRTERFLTGQFYRRHIVKEHFPHLALSCYHCHAFFTKIKQLHNHLRSHPKDPTRNMCPHCSKYFTQSGNLFAHMISHVPENERPVYECYLCKNKFTSRASLRSHMKLHIGVKKISICHQCGKAFKAPSYLKKHMSTHSTRRPFICELCPKRFNRKDSLFRHHREVHDRRQYECDKCDYRTSHKQYLHSHKLRLHQDSLKFPCKDCNKRFLSLRSLKLHQESHSNSSLYRCELCGMATKTKIAITQHHYQYHSKW